MLNRAVSSPSRSDVVVVGAGLAGLAAARTLKDHGVGLVVLEARNRVGGRTLSQTMPSGETIDLGAQWIGPTQNRVAALTREFGLQTFNQYSTGAKIMSVEGKISTYKGSIPSLPLLSLMSLARLIKRLEAMCREVPLDAPYTATRAAEWDGMTVESWKRTSVFTRKTRSVLDMAVRAIFCAEPGEISFLYFLFYLHSAGGLLMLTEVDRGAQQARFTTGTQMLSLRLAGLLGEEVILNASVRAIVQAQDGILIRSDTGEYEAQYVIVAVPPALAARIRYEPPLPAGRDQLAQRMPMGSVIKCVVFYERPFWRDQGFSGEAISDTGPVAFAFDDSPEDASRGALVVFIAANAARRWGVRSAEERKAAVIQELARLFGPKATLPTDYVDKDWASDPWSLGCPVGPMPPGLLTASGAALRAPVGRIHWAGTETATVWNGYMEGAIESGERAAQEVLAALGRG